MFSKNAVLQISVGEIINLDNREDLENVPSVFAMLILPEVEREILYDAASLDEFDSSVFVLDWIEDIKGDAILLECEINVNEDEIIEELDKYYNEEDDDIVEL